MKTLVTACVAALLVVTLRAQTASGVIDGGVVDERGSAVSAASVSLTSESGRLLKTVVADVRGLFMFDNLAEGRYLVSASRMGYVGRSYGQASQSAQAVVIALALNGRFRARVQLPRVGVLSGSIVDESSQGMSAEVRAVRLVTQNGQRVPDERTIKKVTSDRFGRYRFTDVPPGHYIVSAIGPDGELGRMTPEFVAQAEQAVQQRTQPLPSKGTADESTVSYVAVYHPGVLSQARATPVSVAPGEERPDINLQLQVTPTVRMQGTVVTTEGKPVMYANVRVVSPDDGATWSYGQTSATGAFQLAPVPAGPYALITGSTHLEVNARDAASSTVNVRAEPVGSLSGRVQFDGSAAKPDCRRNPCSPMLRPRGQNVMSSPATDVRGVMDEAGPIVFATVPAGTYMLEMGSPLSGWGISSVTLEGRDITDLPIEVGPRQDLSGLVVTFSDRQTELSGTVPVGGMSPTADTVSIVVFSTDRRFWTPGTRRVRVARPDTGGQYRLSGLPPGEYFVAVVRDFDAEAELDGTRLAALEASATRATIGRPEPR
jgi:uncharacterized protein (DUF2141 family)